MTWGPDYFCWIQINASNSQGIYMATAGASGSGSSHGSWSTLSVIFFYPCTNLSPGIGLISSTGTPLIGSLPFSTSKSTHVTPPLQQQEFQVLIQLSPSLFSFAASSHLQTPTSASVGKLVQLYLVYLLHCSVPPPKMIPIWMEI